MKGLIIVRVRVRGSWCLYRYKYMRKDCAYPVLSRRWFRCLFRFTLRALRMKHNLIVTFIIFFHRHLYLDPRGCCVFLLLLFEALALALALALASPPPRKDRPLLRRTEQMTFIIWFKYIYIFCFCLVFKRVLHIAVMDWCAIKNFYIWVHKSRREKEKMGMESKFQH